MAVDSALRTAKVSQARQDSQVTAIIGEHAFRMPDRSRHVNGRAAHERPVAAPGVTVIQTAHRRAVWRCGRLGKWRDSGCMTQAEKIPRRSTAEEAVLDSRRPRVRTACPRLPRAPAARGDRLPEVPARAAIRVRAGNPKRIIERKKRCKRKEKTQARTTTPHPVGSDPALAHAGGVRPQ